MGVIDMIYRKRIPHWTERFGVYHDVWFYTTVVKHESEDCYRKMEEFELPEKVRQEFEANATAVVENRATNEIIYRVSK